MRIGTHLLNWSAAGSIERVTALTQASEEFGFDSVWVTDHVVIPQAFDSVYPIPGPNINPETSAFTLEPLMTLAVLAGATKRVRVGTSVLISAQRDPMLTAKQIATLDALSGGRVEVGVGAGWLREEFDILHAPFEDRGKVLDEHIRIFRTLWNGETKFDGYDGRFASYPPIMFAPAPVQPGGPPISVGGFGRAALKRAATLADGWQPANLTPEQLEEPVAQLRQMAKEAGRRTPDVLLRCAMEVVDRRADDEKRPLVGTPDQIIASIERYAAAGAAALLITPAPGKPLEVALQTMERIGKEIIPAVR